jgi:hypothetical protein
MMSRTRPVVGSSRVCKRPAWSLRDLLMNRVRYRLTHNDYGDQGMFVQPEIFRQLGGFKDCALMEDLDFSQRLKRVGRTVLVRRPVRTSGRRFINQGAGRTCAIATWLLLCHTVGVDVERYAYL